jgi:thymidylate synthase (FAD)
MKVIHPYAKILDNTIGVNVLKKIEYIGRTCYKSEDNITEDSAEKFVANLIKRGHEAMLEHASFCFEIDYDLYTFMMFTIKSLFLESGYKSYIRFTTKDKILMSGNIRAWRDLFKRWIKIPNCFEEFIKENPVLFPEWQDEWRFHPCNVGSIRPVKLEDLKYKDELLVHCDVSVKFVVDRGISHEIVRHRPASFAQESTRYCNYSKGKFGGELTFINPCFLEPDSDLHDIWTFSMFKAEWFYKAMLEEGATPEQARSVLPTSLKTEIVMTANCEEWRHFFELRACNSTGKAHPQMLEVSRPLLDNFKNILGVIFEDLAYGE